MQPISEPTGAPEKKKWRTAIACHPCRQRKRACDGVKPTCAQCCDAAWVCGWPERDRRKREPGLKPRPFPSPYNKNKLDRSSSVRGDKTPPLSTVETATLTSNPIHLHNGLSLSKSTTSPVDGIQQGWNDTLEACQMPDGPLDNLRRRQSSSSWAGPHFWSTNGSTDIHNEGSGTHLDPIDFDGAQRLLALNATSQSVSFDSNAKQYQESGPSSYHGVPHLGLSDAHQPLDIAKVSYEYLRPYGITAIQPGLGRVRLSIRSDPPPSSSSYGPSPSYSLSDNTPHQSHPLVDRSTRLPRSDVRASLISGFFEHFQSIFPFANRYSLEGGLLGRPELGTVFMVNAMCALSARFSDHPEIIGLNPLPFCRGVPFADNAKQLLIPLMGLPSADTAAALLFLSYYAFGMNSESELWMYSGMAMRMAVDLGLGRRMGSRSIRKADRLLFWSIYMLDRILSIGTGRPTTLPDSQIDVNEPLTDFHTELGLPTTGPIPAMYARIKDSAGCTLAFAWAVKMVRLYGKIADIVNGPKFWPSGMTTGSAMPTRAPSPEPRPTLSEASAQATTWSSKSKNLGTADIQPRMQHSSSTNQSDLDALADLENAIVQAYESLPEVLIWNEQNLDEHVGAHDGDMYIHIHLWFQCMIAILYREPLVQVSAAAANISLQDAKQIQRSSAEEIQNIAEQVAKNNLSILLNNCFLNQTFYTAALAWAADSTATPHTSSKLLAKSFSGNSSKALERFQYCAKLLRRQSEIWSGVGWIAAALAKRSSGLSLQDMATKGGVTDTILSETEMRIITNGERQQEEEDLSKLRENLLMTLPDDALDPNGLPMLWGADGLFDAEMDQLFFGLP